VLQKHFLWPKSSGIGALSQAWRLTSVEHIEDKLSSKFGGGVPVLLSSGRVALYIALLVNKVTRKDLIGTFPFASHCVLDAISRLATPLCINNISEAALRVVYHQWGYVQENHLPSNTIEDCVDTLCTEGTKIFPSGGAFEIWSLPKILGTSSGGILWCKDEVTANQVKQIRDSRESGLFLWLMRIYGGEKFNCYWQGAECTYGSVTQFQTGEMLLKLDRWDEIVEKRLINLEIIWPKAISKLVKPTNRLPSVVPILSNCPEPLLSANGLSSGFRMFEQINEDGKKILKRVLPIPIHQDVSPLWLEKILQIV
jgi:putative PLP-dependent aminotransferase (TIGR04422 family)